MANLTGASQLDSGGIPTGSLKVPGVTLLKAIQGGAILTDTLGDDSAPIRAEYAPGSKATYTYSIQATAPGYATPQDWIVLRGSATKLIKVLRVEICGAITAAAGYIVTLKKHTIANTGGTSTNPTPIKHDSSDGANSGTILLYTVAPTTDASATIWKYVRMILQPPLNGAAGTVVTTPYVYDYGMVGGEPMTLRGVAQEFAFNLGGIAIGTGQVYDYTIIWSEE